MGKKRTRKTYSSKGQRDNIKRTVVKLMNRSVSFLDKELFKVKAWQKGLNPWITVANPNHRETAKRNIKVRANALWGDPRGRIYKTYGEEE